MNVQSVRAAATVPRRAPRRRESVPTSPSSFPRRPRSSPAQRRRRRRRRRRTAMKPSAAVRACAAAPPSPAHTVWASGGSSAKVHALFPAVHGEPGLRMRAIGPTTAASSSAQRSRPLHSAATELSIAGGASAAAVHRRGVCARPCSPPDASQPVRAAARSVPSSTTKKNAARKPGSGDGRRQRASGLSSRCLYVLHQVLVTTRSKVRYLK